MVGTAAFMIIRYSVLAQADVDRSFVGNGGFDSFFRFPRVRRIDDRQVGQAAHNGQVFYGLMGGPVGANGETAVADDDLDVQVGQANGITCNFKTPFCKEGVRAGQRDLADGGQTGCRTEEVLFGNADIEEPFRCLVLELFCPCRRGNIRIDDDDVRIFLDFRFQDMTVCIQC